jgi:predicted DNA-binding protein with PD1-like motif
MQKWLFIISISFIISCKSNNMSKPIAFRLKPGADLKLSLDSLVKEHSIKAGWMVTCVGSLTAYHMRYANQTNSGHMVY